MTISTVLILALGSVIIIGATTLAIVFHSKQHHMSDDE